MELEEEIFQRKRIDASKLEPYGFIKEGNQYRYTKEFFDSFEATITYEHTLSFKVMDLESEEEYLPIYSSSQKGPFVSMVRDAYTSFLEDVANHCCKDVPFIQEQSNRLTNMVYETYHIEPEFPFQKSKDYGVFRIVENQKWFGVILYVNQKVLGLKDDKMIEILNVKTNKGNELCKKEGIFPAYHMNHKSWISILLDDTVEDAFIFECLKESHDLIFSPKKNKGIWIVPSNPKFYDIEKDIEENHGIFLWKQSSDIQVNDIVFLYVGSPISAIRYQCVALEVKIPYEYQDQNVNMKYAMKCKVLKTYDSNFMPLSRMKEFGVTTVRGPRSCPETLFKVLK